MPNAKRRARKLLVNERKRLEIRARHCRDQEKGIKGKVKMTSR